MYLTWTIGKKKKGVTEIKNPASELNSKLYAKEMKVFLLIIYIIASYVNILNIMLA